MTGQGALVVVARFAARQGFVWMTDGARRRSRDSGLALAPLARMTADRHAAPPVPVISREELHARLTGANPPALFEVLPLGYWRKHHLPTAMNLPPGQARELVPQLVPDRGAEIVVYCWDDG